MALGTLLVVAPAGVLLLLEPEEALPLVCAGGTVFPTAAAVGEGEVFPVVGVFVATGCVFEVVVVLTAVAWTFPAVGVFVATG